MKQLVITTILSMLLCLIMHYSKRMSTINCSVYEDPYQYSTFWIIVFAAMLIFVEGFRGGYSDTGNYKGIYSSLSDSLSTILDTSEAPGYESIQWLLRKISTEGQFFILVSAAFITIADISFLKKYSTNFVFSLYLYFLTCFISNMNGIRQITAACIMALAFPWLLEKKYVRYVALILLLSTIHRSILVVIPLLFIFAGKRWNKGLIAFELFCAFSVFVPGPINALIGRFAADTYAHYLENYAHGANVLHVVVDAVPLIMGILYHRQNFDNVGENRKIDLLINMQAISFGFMVLATTMAQYARIGMYMRYSTVIIVPFLVENAFKNRDTKLLKILAIILYFALFAVEVLHGYTPGDRYGIDAIKPDFSMFARSETSLLF